MYDYEPYIIVLTMYDDEPCMNMIKCLLWKIDLKFVLFLK